MYYGEKLKKMQIFVRFCANFAKLLYNQVAATESSKVNCALSNLLSKFATQNLSLRKKEALKKCFLNSNWLRNEHCYLFHDFFKTNQNI